MAETDESDRLSQDGSYSSTGPIGCSLAKKYDSTSPSATSDETDEKMQETKAFPSARLSNEDRKEILDILNEETDKPESRIFPKSTENYIKRRLRNLHNGLKRVVTFGWAFLGSSLLRETRPNTFVQIPKCVCCDICLFCASQPVLIITVTLEKTCNQRTQRYNSNVAKAFTDFTEEHTLHSIVVLHGVVEESDLESVKTFSDKVDKKKSDGSKIVLPGSLDMDQEIYSDISRMILERFRKVEPVRLGAKGTPGELKLSSGHSAFSSFSEDSGCIDVYEHMKLKRELEEQKTENKVLQWKLATVSSTHSQSTGEFIEIPGAEDVCDGTRKTDNLKKRTTTTVYEFALHSLEGDFIKEMESSGDFLDVLTVLTQRGLSAVAEESILTLSSGKEQTRKLLDAVQREGMIPQLIEALEASGIRCHLDLGKKLRTKVELLSEMPFLFHDDDATPTSSEQRSEDTDAEIYHGMDKLVLYKQPEKVNIMDSKRKSTFRLCFHLSALIHDGKLGQFESYRSRLQQQFSHEPNVWFHVLECESIKQRIFDQFDTDHKGILKQMEDLVSSLTHPVAGQMILLVRRGSSQAIAGTLQEGLDLLNEARSLMVNIKPCIDTGMVMYAFINLLMLNYENECTAANKDMLIKTIAEAIEAHISQASPEMRDEFSRVLYLKLAFCYLGIGVWGNTIGCPVTIDDLRAAEACFKMIVSIPGTFMKRRSMFFSLAQAVLHYHRGHVLEALKCAEDAKLLAKSCGFTKELGSLDEFANKLHTMCSLKDSTEELDEALTELLMSNTDVQT